MKIKISYTMLLSLVLWTFNKNAFPENVVWGEYWINHNTRKEISYIDERNKICSNG